MTMPMPNFGPKWRTPTAQLVVLSVMCVYIWVRFPRTGIMAKMWSFFEKKVEPSCDYT